MAITEQYQFASTTAGTAILVYDPARREILNILPNIFPRHEEDLAEWIHAKTNLPKADIWMNEFFQKMLFANDVVVENEANKVITTTHYEKLSKSARQREISKTIKYRDSIGVIVTGAALAEICNVDPRTIRRDLKEMGISLKDYK